MTNNTRPNEGPNHSLADELVWIWSDEHQAYWRPDAAGYTRRASAAGIYTRAEAERLTGHCGPEKRIEIEPVPALRGTQETAPATRNDLLELLRETRAQLDRVIGWHTAPGDCYATGPLTGDAFTDLVSCPSCEGLALLARIDTALKDSNPEKQP